MPKRRGYIIPELCENKNIQQGYNNSRHGKTYVHNMLTQKEFNPDEVLNKLQQDFLNGTYKTSDYSVFKIYEPKERIIFRLPYAPDRIAHHVIMNCMEAFWTNKIPNTSYSCVKGRGVHGAYRYLKKCIKDSDYRFCFQGDIKKCFPNIDHVILKRELSRYIKDDLFTKQINEIVDSTDRYVEQTGDGVIGKNLPIGNYLSQYFANLLIAVLYRKLVKRFNKLRLKILIYMDDIVILAKCKKLLHKVKNFIVEALRSLKLELKDNWQIFPIAKHGISFVGFVFYPKYIKLRTRIVKKIYKLCYMYKHNKITKSAFKRSMASYYGWIKYSNTKHLAHRIYEITNIWYSNWNGKLMKITEMYNKYIRVYHIQKRNKYFIIEAVFRGRSVMIKSSNRRLLRNLLHIKKERSCVNLKLRYCLG